jgi:hypothetical protein
MEELDKPLLPRAKHIAAKTIGMDIMPYIPGDKKNNAEWDKIMKGIFQNVKEAFDKKGIPMPTVKIVSDKGPVRLPETIVNNENDETIHL